MSRARPYTDSGLKRVPCAHCGKPAEEQWRLDPCSIGKPLWYPLCLACDIGLNRLILAFLQVPDGDAMLARYIDRKTG